MRTVTELSEDLTLWRILSLAVHIYVWHSIMLLTEKVQETQKLKNVTFSTTQTITG